MTDSGVSIEAKRGVTTGVSAADRVTTVKTAIAISSKPEDLARPGHVFPLIAHKGGLLQRRGHTEGTIELMTLADLPANGLLCELTHKDGSMMRLPALIEFACEHRLPIVSIDDLVQYEIKR
ncbi:3,4-dihydroxy-2-butanone-4-phosphate synthase [Endozoicomonas sp. Mp262]|uniref:3,4-dihydroxy-2-butanone-4-phosphate synthase n=1 Tax=Endozoicomonas sp. Mp262 TaxID=2919499 RepID=UPI0021E0ED26